jgi:two-component system, NarL family, response regulator DevR
VVDAVGGTKVYLLDDHALVREAVAHFVALEEDLDLVGHTDNATECLSEIERLRPDVAVLDVSLPDGSGIQVCREIRSRFPETSCIILTGSSEDSLLDAVLAGASAHLSKTVGLNELIDTIKKVAAGETLLKSPSAQAIVTKIRRVESKETTLTEREERILTLIGRGLTNRQMAEQMHLAEQTVKNYVSNLLGKLGLERRTQAAVYAARLNRD